MHIIMPRSVEGFIYFSLGQLKFKLPVFIISGKERTPWKMVAKWPKKGKKKWKSFFMDFSHIKGWKWFTSLNSTSFILLVLCFISYVQSTPEIKENRSSCQCHGQQDPRFPWAWGVQNFLPPNTHQVSVPCFAWHLPIQIARKTRLF